MTIKRTIIAATLAAMSSASFADLRFWTTEEQPERLAKQEAMAAEFQAKTGLAVEVIPVTESELGKRATAAFAANDLPDVIYHTLQYVAPWQEAGILNVDAATEVVDSLGANTFAPGALSMATVDGDYAAVPVDGWTQLVVYRKDLFEAKGLAAPDSYADIQAALEALHNPPEMYGFVAPTKVDENFMSQVLEHVLLANGATPVSDSGAVGFDEQKLAESLEFYKSLVQASPAGDLYWKQSRELYFAGQAAMIIWYPFILDELAGLRDSAPPTINSDPTSGELASRTGIMSSFAGPSNADGAAWGDVRYFGITSDADVDGAMQFVEYSMNEGYAQTLSIAPEGKFPVRRGDATDASKFQKIWSTLPVGVDRKAPLSDLYDAETINTITSGLATAQRWGVDEGQLGAASKIINSQVINRVVRQYVDGDLSVSDAVAKINQEISAL